MTALKPVAEATVDCCCLKLSEGLPEERAIELRNGIAEQMLPALQQHVLV